MILHTSSVAKRVGSWVPPLVHDTCWSLLPWQLNSQRISSNAICPGPTLDSRASIACERKALESGRGNSLPVVSTIRRCVRLFDLPWLKIEHRPSITCRSRSDEVGRAIPLPTESTIGRLYEALRSFSPKSRSHALFAVGTSAAAIQSLNMQSHW